MSLYRGLPGSVNVAKKTSIIQLVLLSLLAQSCATLSGLAQKNEQSNEQPRVANETTSDGGNVQNANSELESQKKSAKRITKHALKGKASWYGPGFNGKKTASGEIYDQTKFTAAHKTLPLGTKARVTNLDNGSSVDVEINDRGPFIDGRIIDLSRAAANAVGLVETGTAPVRVEVIADPSATETASNN